MRHDNYTPVWIDLGAGMAHVADDHGATLCGLPLLMSAHPRAVKIPHCRQCLTMRRLLMRAKQAILTPCNCGWTGSAPHDRAMCRRERAAYEAMFGKPPQDEGANHKGGKFDKAGRGDAHGDQYKLPGSERVVTSNRAEY